MNKTPTDNTKDHRQRLRYRFSQEPASLSEVDLLEMLLTYVIPRIDVRPIAINLLTHFGSLSAVLSATDSELISFPGLGRQSAIFFGLLEKIIMSKEPENQPALFQSLVETDTHKRVQRQKRGFTDDETDNSIKFLPEIVNHSSIEGFGIYLKENLPYNSEITRERRARYILQRFFPENNLDSPIVYFLSHSRSSLALEAVVFYEIMKTEPLPQRVAEDLVFPNLPLGFLRRSQIEEHIRTLEPDLLNSSVAKAVAAVINLYKDSRTAQVDGNRLVFHLHTNDLEGFLYVLTSTFDQPGMYSFDDIFNSTIHRWMLWDKDWIVRQLYNLRDMGIISKISEIDRINQFTLAMNRTQALAYFFDNPMSSQKSLRDDKNQIYLQGDQE